METTINKVGPVEYELEISATAEDLASDFDKALRTYRKQVDLKGFRKGKVPIGMLKKMYGKTIGHEISEKFVEEVYQETVLEGDEEYDVLGRPTITKLDFRVDDGMDATVRFGVRPEVELADLSEQEIDVLAYEVTEEDVEEELEGLRRKHADVVPHEEEIGEEDYVVADFQRIDPESNTPIIGEKSESEEFFLDSPYLHEELKEALMGKKVGETVRVSLPVPEQAQAAEGEAPATERHHYEITIRETKRRELPELDDAFVGEVTEDQFVSVEELREEIENQLEQFWKQRADNIFQSNIVERMLELHAVPVADSVVEVFLESFKEDLKGQNDGELPEDFDETAFREANRADAEKQARWMIIRDKLIEEEGIEVSDEDLDAFFEKQAAQNEMLDVEQLRRFYSSMPRMKEQANQQVLSEKVFEVLASKFQLVEKDAETLEQEHRERQERMAELAGA